MTLATRPVWSDDVLPGHQQHTISLGSADDGDLAATIVRRGVASHQRAVVYIHGYADYFFQQHLSAAWDDAGYDFVAIDLRRYGRSLRPGNRANYVDAIDEYWPEIDAAVTIAASDHDQVVLCGHSTGGLIAALYAHRGPRRDLVDALVLNSPWFDVKLPAVQAVMWKVAAQIGQYIKHREVAAGESFYVDSIHSSMKGEWDFDLEWKPKVGAPVHPGWSRAIALGHREVHRGLNIDVAILVQHSDRSTSSAKWSDDLLCTDSVLDVGQIHRWSAALGPNVTIQTIPGGMHDLWLSAEPVRLDTANRTFAWLTATLPEISPC